MVEDSHRRPDRNRRASEARVRGPSAPNIILTKPTSSDVRPRPSIHRMPRVERAASGSDLRSTVTARAQALHLARPKPNRIVFVRFDVIDHGCGRDTPTVEAHLAERFQPQLVGA